MVVSSGSFLDEKHIELNDKSEWQRSQSICATGLAVAWKNLSVVAKQRETTGFFERSRYSLKDIVRNVNGGIEPGTLVAILGASGSGKSTLMSVLANRCPGGLKVNGKVTIGGSPIGKFTRYVTGFVYQDDLFVPTLTVMEHLNFMAKLRLDKQTTEKARKALIMEILTELGLLRIANNRIGSARFGGEKVSLSGGERKRLSIATELITDPSLLFCDEPTTGLDSFTALKVVMNLKSLVSQRQKTIVCSVHQPNEQIIALFDQIILLTGGRIAFSGSASDAVTFFEQHGHSYDGDRNQADFLIQCLAKESAATTADKFCSAYEKSEYYANTMKFVDNEMSLDTTSQELMKTYRRQLCEPSWFHKFCVLTHRSYLNVHRDSSVYRVRLFQKLLLGFLIGLCMRNTVTWTQTGLQALKGVIFFMIGQNFFPAIHAAAHHLPKHLPIYLRENANNTTTPLIFYLSTVITLLPGFLVDPILFVSLVHFMVNLPGNIFSLLLTCFVAVIVLNTSAAFGMLSSVLFRQLQFSEAALTPVVTICLVCSGVFIKLSTIPPILRWIRFVSWFTSGVETLFIIQLQDVKYIECAPNPNLPCLRTGDEVLAVYDFHEENLWTDILKILGIYLFLHTCSYVALLLRTRSKKI